MGTVEAAREQFYRVVRKSEAVVVGTNKSLLMQLRSALKSIGFVNVHQSQSMTEAATLGQSSRVSHILFDLRGADMDSVQFVRNVLATNKGATLVVISENPALDNIFELIKAGTRGFLIPPPTIEGVEAVLLSATAGPPLSESILNAEDRNAAFAQLILTLLYRTASTMKDARGAKSAEQLVQRCMRGLRASCETAKMFCDGGLDSLREKIIDACIEHADDRKTRLGELRKSLKTQRQADGSGS